MIKAIITALRNEAARSEVVALPRRASVLEQFFVKTRLAKSSVTDMFCVLLKHLCQ